MSLYALSAHHHLGNFQKPWIIIPAKVFFSTRTLSPLGRVSVTFLLSCLRNCLCLTYHLGQGCHCQTNSEWSSPQSSVLVPYCITSGPWGSRHSGGIRRAISSLEGDVYEKQRKWSKIGQKKSSNNNAILTVWPAPKLPIRTLSSYFMFVWI